MPLSSGTRFGVYEILASMGEGGMGATDRTALVTNVFERLRR